MSVVAIPIYVFLSCMMSTYNNKMKQNKASGYMGDSEDKDYQDG